MARPLVKTHIRGFDEDVLRGGIPQGCAARAGR